MESLMQRYKIIMSNEMVKQAVIEVLALNFFGGLIRSITHNGISGILITITGEGKK
jgi:hypothetical protein